MVNTLQMAVAQKGNNKSTVSCFDLISSSKQWLTKFSFPCGFLAQWTRVLCKRWRTSGANNEEHHHWIVGDRKKSRRHLPSSLWPLRRVMAVPPDRSRMQDITHPLKGVLKLLNLCNESGQIPTASASYLVAKVGLAFNGSMPVTIYFHPHKH